MPDLDPGRHGARAPETTGVPRARSEDIARRRRLYVIQMSIRVLCVIAMPFLPGMWKIVALVGAVVLPYVAVLMANDQREDPHAEAMFDHGEDGPAELTAAPQETRSPDRHVVLTVDEDGTVHEEPVPDDDRPAPEGEGAAPDDGAPGRHP